MNSGKCVGVSVSHMVVLFLSRYPLLRPSLLKDPFEHGFTNRDYVWLCELGHSFHFTPSWVNSCSSFISWNIALRILESLSHRRCAVDRSFKTNFDSHDHFIQDKRETVNTVTASFHRAKKEKLSRLTTSCVSEWRQATETCDPERTPGSERLQWDNSALLLPFAAAALKSWKRSPTACHHTLSFILHFLCLVEKASMFPSFVKRPLPIHV